MSLEKVKEHEREMDRAILKIAKSAKGKHHLVLSREKPLTTNSGKVITFYEITDYENGSARGNRGAENLQDAKRKFKEWIDQWNKHNIKLGKLKIIK